MDDLDCSDLLALSDGDFVALWTALFGEPPAALIDRPEMVEMLLQFLPPRPGLPIAEETRAAA